MTISSKPPVITTSWYQPSRALLERLSTEYQARLESYRHTPHDVKEHVGIESSIAQGGYAHRQIHELIQNGADAVFKGDDNHGWIEVRLTPQYLYVANTGATLDEQGILTLLHAHVSQKRSGEIGRFGVGFKSVLRVTDQPQLFSRQICLGFDAQRTRQVLCEHLDADIVHAPTLRLAWAIEPDDDPHLQEMMQWASSIVRLPIEGNLAAQEALHKEMVQFNASFLLFAPTSLHLTFVNCLGEAPTRRQMYSSQQSDEDGAWTLVDDQQETRWRVRSTRIDLRNHPVAWADAGVRHQRDEYEVHWALPEHQHPGQFWVFFPLSEPAPVPGIISAPWKTSDDRRHLLPGAFNQTLLEEVAAWLASCYVQMSQAARFESMFAALPGASDLSWASSVLFEALASRLVRSTIWPDRQGTPQQLEHLIVPPHDVPSSLIASWAQLTELARALPHAMVFEDDAVRTKFEQFIPEHQTCAVADWVGQVRQSSSEYLVFLHQCWRVLPQHREALSTMALVPTQQGNFISFDDPLLFLPSPQQTTKPWLTNLHVVIDAALEHDDIHLWFARQLRLHVPSSQDIIDAMWHKAQTMFDAPETFWAWMAEVPFDDATAFLRWLVEQSARFQLRAKTCDGHWRDATVAYLGDTGQHAVDVDAMSHVLALLPEAGFVPSLVPANLVWEEADPTTFAVVPLGAFWDQSTEDIIKQVHLVCTHPWSEGETLTSQSVELLLTHGIVELHGVQLPLKLAAVSLPQSWQTLQWTWSWPDALGVSPNEISQEIALDALPHPLWLWLDQQALACDDAFARLAYYKDCFEHDHIPEFIRVDDVPLPFADVMVTSNDELASRANHMGWQVIAVSRVGRLNAMKVGMKLLTGVPRLEPKQVWVKGAMAEVFPALSFWLDPIDPQLQNAKLVLCERLNETVLSAKGRHEQPIEYAWNKGTLYIQTDTMTSAATRTLDAIAVLGLASGVSIARARVALSDDAPRQKWQRWLTDEALYPKQVRLQAARVLIGDETRELSVEWADTLWSVFGHDMALYAPDILSVLSSSSPQPAPNAGAMLGLTTLHQPTRWHDAQLSAMLAQQALPVVWVCSRDDLVAWWVDALLIHGVHARAWTPWEHEDAYTSVVISQKQHQRALVMGQRLPDLPQVWVNHDGEMSWSPTIEMSSAGTQHVALETLAQHTKLALVCAPEVLSSLTIRLMALGADVCCVRRRWPEVPRSIYLLASNTPPLLGQQPVGLTWVRWQKARLQKTLWPWYVGTFLDEWSTEK